MVWGMLARQAGGGGGEGEGKTEETEAEDEAEAVQRMREILSRTPSEEETSKSTGAGGIAQEALHEGLSSGDLSSQSMQALDEEMKIENIDENLLRRFLRAHQMVRVLSRALDCCDASHTWWQDAGKAAHKLRRYFAWRESCSYGLDFPVKERWGEGSCHVCAATGEEDRPVVTWRAEADDHGEMLHTEVKVRAGPGAS
eukprot:763959-Hanusia_phi.AAC.6